MPFQAQHRGKAVAGPAAVPEADRPGGAGGGAPAGVPLFLRGAGAPGRVSLRRTAGAAGDPFENEADRAADAFAPGGAPTPGATSPSAAAGPPSPPGGRALG